MPIGRTSVAWHVRSGRASSLWPVPALFGVIALIAAIISITLDDAFDFHVQGSHFLVGDTNTALTLTSVVATGMLAFLGIVFATTLVAIQLAASQYSPRAVRVFVRSRLTKISLGIFVATFVFSVATLIEIRGADKSGDGFTPVLSTTGVTILVIATIAAFLMFANGTARLMRVQYLLERIVNDTRPGLLAAFPLDDEVVETAHPDSSLPATKVVSRAHGVLDAVDVGDMAELAAQFDGWVEMMVPFGGYVAPDTTIAVVRTRGTVPEDKLRGACCSRASARCCRTPGSASGSSSTSRARRCRRRSTTRRPRYR